MYPPRRYCLIVLFGCLLVCQILYTTWLSVSQGDLFTSSNVVQQNGLPLSPRMVTSSLNRTLATTKGTTIVTLRPTKQRYPKTDNHQQTKNSNTDNLVIPDANHKGYVEHRHLSVKNVPLQLSDDDRRGPVMPEAITHKTELKSRKTRLVQLGSRKQAVAVVSQIFSQNSTESPPQNILDHFQLHSKKMAQFCVQHNHSPELPRDNYTQRELYHHLLYDDSKRIVFCYVPKSGCSNWKRMFAVLGGTVKANDTERPSKDILQGVNKLEYLSEAERNTRLKHYFKFSFVRNPLERIVSGYRNKIAVPINYANRNHWPDRILFQIMKKYEKIKYLEWSKTNFTSADFYPSFEGFVKYLTSIQLYSLNEHFRPFMDLCLPCAINYNFIGNFYNLPDEAYRIISFLGVPRDYYLNRVEHPTTNTSSIVSLYYDTVSVPLKLRLLQKFSQELSMYYQLYPADAKRDVAVLGLAEYLE